MSENPATDETPAYVFATPGRVMSTLAYVMLSQHDWPVYVNTGRNYGYRSSYDTPTDPSETIHGSAHFQPVSEYHPLSARTTPDGYGWELATRYLDDRIRPESETDYDLSTEYHDGKVAVCGAWDEYFILVSGPNGTNVATYSDYSGSTWAASNYRSLLRDYPNTFVEVSSGHGGRELAIPLFVPTNPGEWISPADPLAFDTPHYDRDRAEDLAGTLVGLADDYPVYDDDDMGAYENELLEEVMSDSWWQGEIRDGVATEMAKILIKRAVPADFQLSDIPEDQAHEPDLLERARAYGIDTYELQERLDEWLDEQTELKAEYHYGDGPGYHTVYSLYVEQRASEGYVEYEGATADGVTFRYSEDGYRWVADHIINGHGSIYRTPVEIPLLADENE